MHFTELIDLTAERLGGVVLTANDEFFAPKENLLKSSKPIFVENRYTDRGKWMDGWETRRRRTPGHDWCVIQLGLPGIIRGILVDTSYFKGNYPEQCSIEACAADGCADVERLTSPATQWIEILPTSDLKEDSQNLFPIQDSPRWTHIRFNIFPDGGVARLRVYGEVVPDWTQMGRNDSEIDLVAVENGGLVVACSDMFFGARHNLIMPGRALNMSDGWETRRRRGPGHDWAIIKMGISGAIHRVEVDTSHFRGNFPESCSVEACDAERVPIEDPTISSLAWEEVLPRTKLQADTGHCFKEEIKKIGPVTHARFNIFPDGGVSRLRMIGTVSRQGRLKEGIRRLNALSREEAEAELLQCCGSRSWARRMAEQRPFRDLHQLVETADRVWWDLGRQDWLEAFSRHPRIGEKLAEQSVPAAAGRWSQAEQSGMRGASQATLAALMEANRAYEARFGYLFIVCATGKTSQEMLALLRERLQHDPETELRVAAEEQGRITHLRLEKLLEP